MIERFDAFISYKHAPLDNKVADEIQKGLERYPVPANLRKKLGKQKIERIFRDKSELPITSSLSDNISYALEHSDFLIVICSHSTKLSGWVPREIEYFLKFHPISHVLTVLAEGEPDEVIPAQLLKTLVPKTDADGNTVCGEDGEPLYDELPLEPLSCDWRMSVRKARREELPRLAAAILGCSYDELIQRARAYRRRRMTVFFSIAAVLAAIAIGYLLWSRAQIQKNYEESQANLRQAQVNQSIYLANASTKKFDQEYDGIGAAQLALAALPSEGEDRPVVPDALYAATQALQCYVPEDNYYSVRYPDKKYSMGGMVSDIGINSDKDSLVVLDESGEVAVFDILSQKRLFTASFEDAYRDRMSAKTVGSDQLIVCDGFDLHFFDWKNNQELWTAPLWINENGERFRESQVNGYILTLYERSGYSGRDSTPNVAFCVSNDKSLIAVDGANDVIRILDAKDGSEKERLCAGISENPGLDLYQNNIQKIIWSDDDRYIAAVYVTESDPGGVSILVYDREEKAWQQYDTGEENWEDLCFAGNDRILLLTNKGPLDGSYIMQYFQGDGTYLQPSEAEAWCYSASEKKLLWNTSLFWEYPWETNGDCLYGSVEVGDVETAVFSIANTAYALNMSDGSVYISQTFTETVLSIFGVVGDDILLILRNGDIGHLKGYPSGENDGQSQFPFIYKGNTQYFMKKMLVVPDEKGTRAICFSEYSRDVIGFAKTWDHDGQVLSTEGMEDLPLANWIEGENLVVVEESGLSVMDISTGKKRFELPADWDNISGVYNSMRLMQEHDSIGALVMYGEQYVIWIMDLTDGSTKKIPLDAKPGACCCGFLYRIETDENGGAAVALFSLKDQTTEIIPISIPGDDPISDSTLITSPDGRKIVADTEDNSICILDLDTKEGTVLRESLTDSNYFVWSKDGAGYSLISNTNIRLYSTDGELLFEIPTNGRNCLSACFNDEYLYVLYDTARVFRYRLSDGTEDGVASAGIYENSQSSFNWKFIDGYLYLSAGSDRTGRMTVIDLEEMKRVSIIDSCCGYSPDAGKYIVLNHAEDDLDYYVSFPQYTADDLRQKCLEFIGENEMSAEMKAAYGL